MTIVFAILFIAFAVYSRVIPHAPNLTPMVSLALFAGAYFGKRFSFSIPIAALLISDIIIGFYGSLMLFVYGSMIVIALIGSGMRGRVSSSGVFWNSVFGAIVFYIISNLGVWALPNSGYPKTIAGLVECYTLAIPFFRNTLLGAFVYSIALFGLYEFAIYFYKRVRWFA